MKIKITIALLSLLILSGCANWAGRKAEMENRYHGYNIDKVIMTLGVPNARVNLNNGGQVIEYKTYRNGYLCEDTFYTNSEGIVTSSRHGGQNGCAVF